MSLSIPDARGDGLSHTTASIKHDSKESKEEDGTSGFTVTDTDSKSHTTKKIAIQPGERVSSMTIQYTVIEPLAGGVFAKISRLVMK